MIIEKKLAEELLSLTCSTGADFAEIYAERTLNDGMSLE